MSEEERPKRKFWQFHLSTAFLMMVTASGFTWANCVRDDIRSVYLEDRPYGECYYGWPTAILYVQTDLDKERVKTTTVYVDGIVKNVGILILALGIVVCLNEELIRRREARQT